MARRGRPPKNPPTAREVQVASRLYRGHGPQPRECECGCSIFTPLHEGQRFRTNACRQAMYRFKKRRRAKFERDHSPEPFSRDAIVTAHAEAADRHLAAIERAATR